MNECFFKPPPTLDPTRNKNNISNHHWIPNVEQWFSLFASND
jgi:hypothetical protein